MRERGQRRVSFKLLALLLFLAVLACSAFSAYWAASQRATLPDGSTLELVGVTVGSNLFLKGTPLEKILGNRIPTNGFSFASLKIERPQRFSPPADTPLTLWLQLAGRRGYPSDLAYLWQDSRIFAANRTGRRLENFPAQQYARLSSNEVLLAVPLYAFPRNRRTIQLQIVPPEVHGQTVEFEFRNPLPAKPQHWIPHTLPSTNRADDLALALLSATAQPPQVQLKTLSKDWHLAECRIADEEGNSFSWSQIKALDDTTFQIQFPYSLDPGHTWSLNTKWIRAATFPISQTSLFPDDKPVQIHLTSTRPTAILTNAIGETFLCRLDGPQLSIEDTAGRDRPYWAFLSAIDDTTGSPVPFDGGATWDAQPRRAKIQKWWTTNLQATNLTLQLAPAKAVKLQILYHIDATESSTSL